MIVERESGTTLVLNDLIFNLANRPGFVGWLFKTIGMTGDEPHIPAPIRMREVKDKAAVATQLADWAHLPRLKRVIISHGEIITKAPSGVLSRVAGEL